MGLEGDKINIMGTREEKEIEGLVLEALRYSHYNNSIYHGCLNKSRKGISKCRCHPTGSFISEHQWKFSPGVGGLIFMEDCSWKWKG